jgi:hypothetical protein
MNADHRGFASFEDLLARYYGHGVSTRPATVEDLYAEYYGKPPARRGEAVRAPKVVLSLSTDDGEVLAPRGAGRPVEEYVVPDPRPAVPFADEYVVGGCAGSPGFPEPPATQRAPTVRTQPAMAQSEPGAGTEQLLDILSPLDEPEAPASVPYVQIAATPPPARTPVSGEFAVPAAAEVSEDELVADMQAILSGQKVYDPATKQTVESTGSPPARSQQRPPANGAPDGHAIFERIAESMEFANAYDLGTVEMENRFTDFDRIFDSQRASGRRQPARDAADRPPVVGGADFIQDLDEMRRARESTTPVLPSPLRAVWDDDSVRDGVCAPAGFPSPESGLSRPLYDTGEHVLAGGNLYPGVLRVGTSPGVACSYGQLIAMADLYESVDQLMRADPTELTAVKSLIERSTSYHQGGKSASALDVRTKDWNDATHGRYLKLADDNYAHFAPNVLFQDPVARAANRHGDHKSAWEAHHRRAIEEAQRMRGADSAALLHWPLTINAFGDHFLTDAFASGHLINKEVMIAYFMAKFYSGRSLVPAAEDFFGRVAKLAFVGNVRKKFSALETVEYPVCTLGWCVKWRPNIDTESAFRQMLSKAATEEPLKVANFVVKALHDRLNQDGVEVSNTAGEGTWTLSGDGFLNPTSLKTMRKAVQQSAANITDPAIRTGTINLGSYFEKVWRYVPQPTQAARASLVTLVNEYTSPGSAVLAAAAAKIISDQVDSLIDVLIDEGKLKPA